MARPPAGAARRALPDYTTVTELPDSRASLDQRRILQSRYELAGGLCRDRDVLEVACGSGIGLGYLARRARSVFGGDIDESSCAIAAGTYRSRPGVRIGRIDAHRLPFRDCSFDVIVLFEALYYLDRPDVFLDEARRVLRPGGDLVISTVNRRWSGFNPSPFSKTYFDAWDLRAAMERRGFETRILAAFPEARDGLRSRAVGALKRIAARWGLIPKTMRGKEWLKKLAYGPLNPLPRELPENYETTQPISEIENPHDYLDYRILYAVGKRS
jgi:SAM-dependent methyltransferase